MENWNQSFTCPREKTVESINEVLNELNVIDNRYIKVTATELANADVQVNIEVVENAGESFKLSRVVGCNVSSFDQSAAYRNYSRMYPVSDGYYITEIGNIGSNTFLSRQIVLGVYEARKLNNTINNKEESKMVIPKQEVIYVNQADAEEVINKKLREGTSLGLEVTYDVVDGEGLKDVCLTFTYGEAKTKQSHYRTSVIRIPVNKLQQCTSYIENEYAPYNINVVCKKAIDRGNELVVFYDYHGTVNSKNKTNQL